MTPEERQELLFLFKLMGILIGVTAIILIVLVR